MTSDVSGVSDDALDAALQHAGGGASWAAAVLRQQPFADLDALLRACAAAWDVMSAEEWEAALAANAEETLPPGAEETRRAAAVALRLYRERFGIPFVSAVHSPVADELLMRVRIRLGNDPAAELDAARSELRRIVRQRLERSWPQGLQSGGGS